MKTYKNFINEFGFMYIGKENAITSKSLSHIKKITPRNLRRLAHEFRVEGFPILSSSEKGYYIPKNLEEITRYKKETRSRIMNLNETVRFI